MWVGGCTWVSARVRRFTLCVLHTVCVVLSVCALLTYFWQVGDFPELDPFDDDVDEF